jgi:2-polyprenyl-6-methoxyphenol hydroxylase-like FAD-dependent oxidoreductase
LTPIWGFRRTENLRRHYEAALRRPERFVAVGDAVCAFNPLYGQGTTVAALGAAALDSCLSEARHHGRAGDLTGFEARFQQRLASVSGSAWRVATSGDLKRQATSGASRIVQRWQRRYLDRVFAAALEHREVNLATLRVLHMLAPPTSLLHPAVAVQALRVRRRPMSPVVAPPPSRLARVT